MPGLISAGFLLLVAHRHEDVQHYDTRPQNRTQVRGGLKGRLEHAVSRISSALSEVTVDRERRVDENGHVLKQARHA